VALIQCDEQTADQGVDVGLGVRVEQRPVVTLRLVPMLLE
jgi:hypothetical protein